MFLKDAFLFETVLNCGKKCLLKICIRKSENEVNEVLCSSIVSFFEKLFQCSS